MRRLILAVAVIGILGIAASAKAETWQGKDWNTLSSGGSFTNDGFTLDFITDTGSSGQRFAAYAATNDWGQYDLSKNLPNDFSYAVKFDDNYSGTGENGFDFGLINLDTPLNPTYSLQASFENYNDNTKHFRISIGDVNDNTELFDFVSPVSEGWMGLKYDKTSHELNFSLFDNNGIFQVGNVIPNANDPKYGSMNVFMTGSTRVVDIPAGTLRYTDFSDGSTLPFSVTTPEPVSCVLFLLGGGAMGLRRYRRKSK